MTPDLLDKARPPRRKMTETPEHEPHSTITNRWTDFQDQRTVDDTPEGIQSRLEAIDRIIANFQREEWIVVNNRIRRVQTVRTDELS